MLLLNLQKCRVKPAEQNHVKLYDPIGMHDTAVFARSLTFLCHS